MLIDENKLLKIAKLAKIEIKKEEVDKFLKLMNNDLDGIKDVFLVDTDDIQDTTANPYYMTLETYKDEISDGEKRDEVLSNAPKQMYDCYAVPKIIEG